MKIISISGLDGSGKSTQIEMLKTYFVNQGKKVFYFHAVQFSVGNIMKKNKKVCEIKSVVKATWLQIQLRKIALWIDICRFKKLRSNLEKQGYEYLLSDRFFYDSVVNLAFLTHMSAPPGIEKRIPLSDTAIYLKTNPEAIMQRPRVPDQGLAYLKEKQRLYDMFATLWNMNVIDGNMCKEEIFAEILKKISNSPNS